MEFQSIGKLIFLLNLSQLSIKICGNDQFPLYIYSEYYIINCKNFSKVYYRKVFLNKLRLIFSSFKIL